MKVRDRINLPMALLFVSSSSLFLLTAALGVCFAAVRNVAWERFSLLSAGVLLSVGGLLARRRWEVVLAGLGTISAAAAALIALSFGLRLSSSDNAAFTITVLLPMGVLSAVAWRRKGNRLAEIAVVSAIAAALAGLILAGERSAWISMTAGVTTALMCGWCLKPDQRSRVRFLAGVCMVSAGATLIAGIAVLMASPAARHAVMISGNDPFNSRVTIWGDALTVARDYFFTGSGLGQTAMVLSTYVYLLHVPFIFHAYNLFLQVAVEQGVPGLVAWLCMLSCAGWGAIRACAEPRPELRNWGMAALAGLVAMCTYGLVDAGAYVSRLAPLLFVPLAVALIAGSHASTPRIMSDRRRSRTSVNVLSVLTPYAACAGLFLMPGTRGTLRANRACVEQTVSELSIYHWPESPIQDQVRRDRTADLTPAVEGFYYVLSIDPLNVTAHRRLGQIALARGDYVAAREHLEVAYRICPQERPTIQMLGEVDAILGDTRNALTVWGAGNADIGRLELRRWWYVHLGGRQEIDAIDTALALYRQSGK